MSVIISAIAETISFLFLSVWALVAYSFFSIPILTLSIFIIERWTRRESVTGTEQ